MAEKEALTKWRVISVNMSGAESFWSNERGQDTQVTLCLGGPGDQKQSFRPGMEVYIVESTASSGDS